MLTMRRRMTRSTRMPLMGKRARWRGTRKLKVAMGMGKIVVMEVRCRS
jgi:hypothetical protein